MKKRVVVTGMGVCSPIGNTLDKFYENNINGVSGYDYWGEFPQYKLKSRVAGKIKGLDANISTDKSGRPAKLALNATIKALESARLDLSKEDRSGIGVCLANAIADTPFSEKAFQKISNGEKPPEYMYEKGMFSFISYDVSRYFDIQGESFVMSTGCTGGIDSVGYGFSSVSDGDHDVMICGASEAPLTLMTFSSFDAIGALASEYNNNPKAASRPFDMKRNGFVLSEGCGIIILESLEFALKRKAPIFAEIKSFSSSNNAYHMTDLPRDGKALAKTIRDALKQAKLEPHKIDYINAHGSSTKQNDYFETLAYKEVFRDNAYDIPISSTKSMAGHPLSAASAIEIILCVQVINNGIIPPTINQEAKDPECDLNYVCNNAIKKRTRRILTTANGFSGIHSAMIIQNFEEGK